MCLFLCVLTSSVLILKRNITRIKPPIFLIRTEKCRFLCFKCVYLLISLVLWPIILVSVYSITAVSTSSEVYKKRHFRCTVLIEQQTADRDVHISRVSKKTIFYHEGGKRALYTYSYIISYMSEKAQVPGISLNKPTDIQKN